MDRIRIIRADDFENAIKFLGLKRCRETFLLRNYQLLNMELRVTYLELVQLVSIEKTVLVYIRDGEYPL